MKHIAAATARPINASRRGLLIALGVTAGSALLAACTPPALDSAPPATAIPATAAANSPTTVALPTVTPTPDAAAATVQAATFAQESIRLVNEARTAAGLPALAERPLLTQVAMNYSKRMAEEDFYGHEDPQGRDVADRLDEAGYLAQMSAENIASGQPDAATVVEGWLNSPDHRANILNAELTEIGAGYAYTPRPPYHHYWTHVFGTPDPSVGRDRNNYPAEALAQINQLRQQAGVPALAGDNTLNELARNYLATLLAASDYSAQVNVTLDAVTEEALQSFPRTVALSAAGSATPEEVVAQWAERNTDNPLVDATYTAAGLAYSFVEEDDYRHYWLLLLVGQ